MTFEPNILNANTKTLVLVVVNPFVYPNYSVLIHSENVEKQYH